MGRIFEKRKDRMFARWAKTSKAFTKVGKEISIAVKLGGAEAANNPRLRMAIQTARSLNMPKDRIESAIKRASGKDEAELHEVIYEAYGPYGVALIIQTATNNPTRTVANVRSILTHRNANLANSGALSYLFARRGSFVIPADITDIDTFELEAIDYGLEDIFETDEGLLIYTSFENFGQMQHFWIKKIEIKSAATEYYAKTSVQLSEEQEKEIEHLIAELEEDDDVQHVYRS